MATENIYRTIARRSESREAIIWTPECPPSWVINPAIRLTTLVIILTVPQINVATEARNVETTASKITYLPFSRQNLSIFVPLYNILILCARQIGRASCRERV